MSGWHLPRVQQPAHSSMSWSLGRRVRTVGCFTEFSGPYLYLCKVYIDKVEVRLLSSTYVVFPLLMFGQSLYLRLRFC